MEKEKMLQKKGKETFRFRKYRKKIIVGVAVIIMIGVLIILFSKVKGKGNRQNPMMGGTETTELKKMDLVDSISATGTLSSTDTVNVSSDLTNCKVTTVKAKVGDNVNKGDVICVMDTTDLEEQLEEAKAELSDSQTQNAQNISSAQKKLNNAKKSQTSSAEKSKKAVSEAKAAYTKAKKEESNSKKLYLVAKKSREDYEKTLKEPKAEDKTYQDLVTKEESQKKIYQEAVTQAEQAKKAYDQAVDEQDTSKENSAQTVEQQEDALLSAQTQNQSNLRSQSSKVSQLEKQISDAQITAPVSGTLTSLGVTENETYTGGNVAVIENCSDFEVVSTVDEYDISNVSTGQKVIIKTDATGDTEFNGEITYVAVSPSSSQTSSSGNSDQSMGSSQTSSSGYEIKVSMEDSDQKEKLRIGMTAKLSIVLSEEKDVFAVPYDAIKTNQDGDKVIVSDGKEIKVTTGVENDYYVSVSSDELEEGMRIEIPSDTNGTDQTNEKKDDEQSGFGQFGGKGQMPSGGGNPGGSPGGNQGQQKTRPGMD